MLCCSNHPLVNHNQIGSRGQYQCTPLVNMSQFVTVILRLHLRGVWEELPPINPGIYSLTSV